MGVGEDAALRQGGGAGGVGEGGDVAGGQEPAAFGDGGVRQPAPGGGDLADGAGLVAVDGGELPQVFQVRQFAADGGEGTRLVHPLDRAGPGPGVAQDPADLTGGGGGMHGDGDEAGGPGGEVEEGPLVAGAGHDGEPVAGGEPVGDEALGDGQHLAGELGAGDVVPGAVPVLAAERDGVGGLLGVDERDVGEAALFDGGHQRGQRRLQDGAVGAAQPGAGDGGRWCEGILRWRHGHSRHGAAVPGDSARPHAPLTGSFTGPPRLCPAERRSYRHTSPQGREKVGVITAVLPAPSWRWGPAARRVAGTDGPVIRPGPQPRPAGGDDRRRCRPPPTRRTPRPACRPSRCSR